MGYSISWLAIKGREPEAIHRQLGVSGTGEFGDYADFPLVGRELPSGWYLLVAKGCDHTIISDSILAEASSDCSLVACSIEEHVMFCSSAFWNKGARIWEVKHRGGDYGPLDLIFEGILPAGFNELRESYFAKQESEGGEKANVDWIFEIPLNLAKSLAGFKHDEKTPGVEDGSFEVLRINERGILAKATKPWWRFW